ncbi:Alpha/Beta hydrolase protein [Roridomyces roridus]|uniref:Alpha/Beta hydrolase protein n=1 Tax=Roridomyces roridus TaxID=1738132 RepID=A0AAD7FYI3_9AGAR|nr:Alpha/Beta hydrolase protein [Roridomyces roridus]
MSSETPFQISVPDESLSLLRQKLALVTFPDELEDAGWDYGVPLADMRRLVDRWANGYDWRSQEARLNAELPQFTRDVEVEGHGTLNIHYIHKKSETKGAIPLLFVHGWPGCFYEGRKLVPILTQTSPDHPSFHVVMVSLPGFGFSQAPAKKGFLPHQYAEVCHKLMLALGYDQYVTQGGDWGFAITRKIAHLYGPEHSKAWHTNFPVVQRPTLFTQPLAYLGMLLTPLTAQDKAKFKRSDEFNLKGRGYSAEMSTKPQTVGYSLADSPVGLLAWIYEKLVAWTDGYVWDDDEVLTWVSIYWFSRAGPGAPGRIYYELGEGSLETQGSRFLAYEKTSIPLGVSRFPGEILVLPKSWTTGLGNIVFDREHESGGHFAAYEKPEALSQDLRDMFARGGPAFGVVTGKNGYD